MTTTHRNFGRFASLAALFLALLVCTSAVQAAEASSSLSKKELKALSAISGGHERLAAYYREKAQHLRAKAQEFSAQADYLATQPATIESKQGISCNCTSHYRYFSELYAREAKGCRDAGSPSGATRAGIPIQIHRIDTSVVRDRQGGRSTAA